MGLKSALESFVVGLVVQVAIGWISPFTPLIAGFVAGILDRNEKEGTIVGFFVGLAIAFGFVLRIYLNLAIPYIYPTAVFLEGAGIWGVAIIVIAMIALGTIGGRVGGAVIRRTVEDRYMHGEMAGEVRKEIRGLGKGKNYKKGKVKGTL